MSTETGHDQETAERLRALRQQVRREFAEPFDAAALRQQDEGLLYGNRDLQLFPQLQQHLEELASLYSIQERPFRSHIPLLGRFISWFRERWNRISTKWYVLPLIEQQSRFNLTALRVLQDLRQFVQTSSVDLVHRMDALFRANQQEYAALAARTSDLEGRLEAADAAMRQMEREYAALEARLEAADATARQQQDLLQAINRQIEELRTMLWQIQAQMEVKIQQVAQEQQLDRQGLAFQRIKLDRLMAQLAAGAERSMEERAGLQEERTGLLDHEYFRFESLYRNEEEVRQNQRIYLPYFEGRQHVLDLGCGKGEFLELLRESGIEAQGVDLNEQMVRICQEKGLTVVRDDAVRHLAEYPDNSLGGIFAAHLIEHLPEHLLHDLVRLAQAKLQPGAYLILETPNPLCLWALVNYFYLDLSHERPLHPQGMAFLLEGYGFRDVEIRYLHPVPEGVRMVLLPQVTGTPWEELGSLLNTNLERLNALLYGFSDYAVIARKS